MAESIISTDTLPNGLRRISCRSLAARFYSLLPCWHFAERGTGHLQCGVGVVKPKRKLGRPHSVVPRWCTESATGYAQLAWWSAWTARLQRKRELVYMAEGGMICFNGLSVVFRSGGSNGRGLEASSCQWSPLRTCRVLCRKAVSIHPKRTKWPLALVSGFRDLGAVPLRFRSV